MKNCLKNWKSHKRFYVAKKLLKWQHDNATPHSSILTREFFKKENINRLVQPPYSPDMNLCDRFLFRRFKTSILGKEFSSS